MIEAPVRERRGPAHPAARDPGTRKSKTQRFLLAAKRLLRDHGTDCRANRCPTSMARRSGRHSRVVPTVALFGMVPGPAGITAAIRSAVQADRRFYVASSASARAHADS